MIYTLLKLGGYLEPENIIIEPTNKTHRIIFTVITILLTAAVVGGSLWYVMDKQVKEQQKQVDELNKKVEDSKKSEVKTEAKKEEVKTEEKKVETPVVKDETVEEQEARDIIKKFSNSYKDGGSVKLFDYFSDPINQQEKDDKARWSTCNNLAGTDPGGPCFGVNSGSKKILSYEIESLTKNSKGYVVKVLESTSYWGGSPVNSTVKTNYEIKKINNAFLIDRYYGESDNGKYSGFGAI